ncbi:Chitobiase/beta-hexosaminidase C-terminal domain-containing protein [Sporobacter termitidis DSM 10068]|uniref:Chitobiase/beta-hexosaminidase C-terminal domain-containing protein n=1 Tax=Sporobacter termitidis DSM 10068 TaxID=1123282 RepID=A0A1M5YHK7_9FIRM|nr:chitobiase/beta-hexosaminidase C-terminal domain-containing protein [Sporobacter termitidis]SHI11452.1 Chitobiase/beta-hexosaminidase C-terminal domain-containing protein [Sporobacter termitidis DSM 10068]
MAVNLTTTYSPLIAERFKQQSFTDNYAGKKYTLDGSKSIVVYSVNKAVLNNYDRTLNPFSGGSRFGTIAELGDTTQTLQMTQDKSFTFSIDSGNKADQLNIKQCNEQLKSNWDEVCTPAIDMYRLGIWANGAGCGKAGSALTNSTAMTAIMTASAVLSNRLVPKKNRVLLISETAYINCKLSTELVGIPNLGQASIANGKVGTIDGMDVITVPDSYFPAGVYFIIKYVDATVDPLKLKVLRVQKNPLGIDGDVGECRFYHDSFVLDAKVNGIYVYGNSASMLDMPVVSGTASVTVACAGATAIRYTTDGTNPKTSETAATYASAVALSVGQTLRVYGSGAGYVSSPIAEFTRTV